MTGIPVIDEASAIQAGRWFNARGVRYALITMAAAGAVLVSADEVAHFAAIPVNVVDTTAAGDAFAGYLGASIALDRAPGFHLPRHRRRCAHGDQAGRIPEPPSARRGRRTSPDTGSGLSDEKDYHGNHPSTVSRDFRDGACGPL